jgi:hypothetical protein
MSTFPRVTDEADREQHNAAVDANRPQVKNSRRTVGILQPGYLPWLGFFEQLYRSDVFVIYDDVQYEKGGWRNRNRIKAPNGVLWLTVPVLLKGKGLSLIKDVTINSSENWQKKHIKTITQNYQKAKYFEAYANPLFDILNRSYTYLIDLDLALIDWLREQLGITTPMLLASEIGISGTSERRLIDIIKFLEGDHFYEGSAGRNYLDLQLFEDAGISVTFQDYQHPRYQQLHGDFVSHLSIIDLLFNCGSQSQSILAGAGEGERT